jgi:hypothetical protein
MTAVGECSAVQCSAVRVPGHTEYIHLVFMSNKQVSVVWSAAMYSVLMLFLSSDITMSEAGGGFIARAPSPRLHGLHDAEFQQATTRGTLVELRGKTIAGGGSLFLSLDGSEFRLVLCESVTPPACLRSRHGMAMQHGFRWGRVMSVGARRR